MQHSSLHSEATLELILGWPGDIHQSRLADAAAPQGYEERSRRMTRHLESIVSKFNLVPNQRCRKKKELENCSRSDVCVCVCVCERVCDYKLIVDLRL